MVPYVQQLVLPHVPVECWTMDADEHSFLDGPGMTVNSLCTMLNCSGPSECPVVMVDGGGGFKMFLYTFT